MADKSSIEWTEATWNPTTGCDKVSPGCDNCYAMTLAKRLKAMGSAKYQNDGDPRTSGPGFGVTIHSDAVTQPLHWRAPRRVFVNSMSDLFHARVPREFLIRVWDVMSRTPQHTYQILTKRPDRMARVLRELPAGLWQLPLPNVWLGTSVENQKYADLRIPALLDTPAAVRFLSCEPLLGPVDLAQSLALWQPGDDQPWKGDRLPARDILHWVIVGGESGPGARPMRPDWARALRDECLAAGVPYFFKQWGGRTPKAGGRELDGSTHDGYPEMDRA
jgi:protein gp37